MTNEMSSLTEIAKMIKEFEADRSHVQPLLDHMH